MRPKFRGRADDVTGHLHRYLTHAYCVTMFFQTYTRGPYERRRHMDGGVRRKRQRMHEFRRGAKVRSLTRGEDRDVIAVRIERDIGEKNGSRAGGRTEGRNSKVAGESVLECTQARGFAQQPASVATVREPDFLHLLLEVSFSSSTFSCHRRRLPLVRVPDQCHASGDLCTFPPSSLLSPRPLSPIVEARGFNRKSGTECFPRALNGEPDRRRWVTISIARGFRILSLESIFMLSCPFN